MNENAKKDPAADMPKRLGRYLIREMVGSGTHGNVYKGYDPYVGRMVALKVGKLAENAKNEEASLSAHQNLFKEARTTGFLQHPNIVSLYDVGVEHEFYYIVMEYVEGKTLTYYCSEDHNELSDNPQNIIKLFYECCLALQYSHNNKVLHRDIKPSNIMLTKDKKVKIMDFSIAIRSQSESQASQIIGSPTYMSPEQIMGKPPTQATDQFSLAVVIFFMLAKKPPLYHTKIKELFKLILKTTPPPLSDFRPELPLDLTKVLSRAMDKDPSKRYSSCKAFGEELMLIYRSAEKVSSNNRLQQNDLVSKLTFFNGFSQDEIDLLINESKFIRSNNGEIIIQEGVEGRDFYVIISGEVDIIKEGSLIVTLKSGDAFGEMCFIGRQINLKRTATAKSRGESMVLEINPTVMLSFPIEAQLNYYKVFCEALAYRLWLTTSKLAGKR